MANTDFTNPFGDMLKDLNVDMSVFNDAFKNSAAFSEKFTGMALAAAEKNAEISSKWAKDTLGKLAGISKAQDEPADYSKTVADFASASAEAAKEHVAAFAEVAKKVQQDTVELLMAAGKDAQVEATAAVKKATTEAGDAVKKATADATAAVSKVTTEATDAVKKATKKAA